MLTGAAQPRVGGVEVELEQLRDLGDRELLELDEREHGALVLVHRVENLEDGLGGLRPRERGEGVGGGDEIVVADRFGTGIAARLAAVRARDPTRDREQPRGNRGAAFELAEPPVDDDERILRRILERGLRHAERAQQAPHEREVRLVDTLERELLDVIHVRQGRHGRWCREGRGSVTADAHCHPTSIPSVQRADIGEGA